MTTSLFNYIIIISIIEFILKVMEESQHSDHNIDIENDHIDS